MPGLGRRPAPDPRDAAFRMRAALPSLDEVQLPTRKTWRFRGPILDQGETSSCVGHAWKEFLMAQPFECSAKKEPSAFAIYDAACAVDEFSDNDHDTGRHMGSSVRGGAKALSIMGRLAEYLWATTLQEAVRWLCLKGPIVIGSNWYSSMFQPDSEGIVKITPTAKVVGGHAYLIRGINRKRALAYGPQSWGTEFGKKGHVYYPLEVLERLIHEDGECATAVERRVVKTQEIPITA